MPRACAATVQRAATMSGRWPISSAGSALRQARGRGERSFGRWIESPAPGPLPASAAS